MRRVVFIYNDLLDEKYQKQLRLPLEFICFGYIENAVMYDIKGKYYAVQENVLKRTSKYNKVYGALYILHNSEHFLRVLDAVMVCSKSYLGKNHELDISHRQKIKAYPIHFKSIEEFLKLKYNEGEGLEVITYLANPNNDVIKTNVLNSVRNRVIEGLDINNFINLVIKECGHND